MRLRADILLVQVAACPSVKGQGFPDGAELGSCLEAEADIGHGLELQQGDDPKANAKHRFEQELEARLKDWDARLEELKARARGANAEVCAEFEVQLEALAGDRALAQEKLQELHQHGQWAWEDLKDGAEKAWSELREAIEHSASCFK